MLNTRTKDLIMDEVRIGKISPLTISQAKEFARERQECFTDGDVSKPDMTKMRELCLSVVIASLKRAGETVDRERLETVWGEAEVAYAFEQILSFSGILAAIEGASGEVRAA
jgi:hypothetical protein